MEKEIQARRQATPQGLVGGATRVGRRLIYSRDVRDWSQAAESVVGLFYTMKRATWRSARQHVNAVRTCDTERLEQSLAEAAAAFPGCAERVLAVLIHVRAFSLADALDCMKAYQKEGYTTGHRQVTADGGRCGACARHSGEAGGRPSVAIEWEVGVASPQQNWAQVFWLRFRRTA